MKPINLHEKLGHIHDYWNPRIVGELNGQHVKLAKLKGEFLWHQHVQGDELFFVLNGTLILQFRDGETTVREGECCIVPRGTEHRPIAHDEVHVLLFEPAGTLNTGTERNERTVDQPEWI